jgi:spoIIIJ-associated protein
MRSVEVEGTSVDEAIGKALESLGLDRERVEIEVLDNPTRGFLGLGGRLARVRATVRGESAEDMRPIPAAVSRETPTGQPGLADLAARAREMLLVILGHLVDSPRVEERAVESDSGIIRFAIAASDAGTLIGRRGQTLDALEHLVSRVVFRDGSGPQARIELDVEGYRERRRQSLEQLAQRLAAEVRTTRRAVTLEPMSARDRRVVHVVLQGDPDVTTRSEGEGLYKALMILPQGGGSGR